jgi:Outer membrane protein beta-barrel domain
MKRYVYSMGAVMLLGCCMPALAQDDYGAPPPGPDYHPAKRYFAGGYTVATGEAANFVDNGWNFGSGVQWRLPPGPVSLRLGIEYDRNKATDQLLSEGAAANQTRINHGWSELFSMDLDAVFDIPLSGSINAYVLAGGGGAIRRINLTQTVGTGGPHCNDWPGFCDAGGYPGDVLVDSKTTGRWEWNAGVGLKFSINSAGDAFFVEARCIEVETPVPTVFVPIRVGLLFW